MEEGNGIHCVDTVELIDTRIDNTAQQTFTYAQSTLIGRWVHACVIASLSHLRKFRTRTYLKFSLLLSLQRDFFLGSRLRHGDKLTAARLGWLGSAAYSRLLVKKGPNTIFFKNPVHIQYESNRVDINR